jgi:hypothetical protein
MGAINLPADAYLHPGAPTEWWWHIGTLQAADRVFGFEINAASFSAVPWTLPVSFTQVMLSDPADNAHYQSTTIYPYGAGWAESDPSQTWYAKLGPWPEKPNDWVRMTSNGTDIYSLDVTASLTDQATSAIVLISLQMTQSGPPLLHWGTGEAPNVDPHGKGPLQQNNY